ncbi:hypothetical protein TSOC_006865 [Tetrabaena socialis]|uniref:Uncharacterized protein n=1 Tax=Tetrabaena socialis TaxID=47790 RepID=A0A2J8A2L7_9CHLO|nr:hypothetical protein TSOC_006865 [Tetrabaena socialis]|eukprot:PNH06728.1 hypothetical protein TSOC_006865 [Tetrabaena socialis]
MPRYYAPCLVQAIPALEYGEELVYPDFEATLPGFFNRLDADAWIQANYGHQALGQTGSNRRVVVDTRQGTVAFLGLRGQNLAFRNVRYFEGSNPPSWVDDSTHCMGHMHAFPHWREGLNMSNNQSIEGGRVRDTRQRQHWLDHTTKSLMQSAHLISPRTIIIPGRSILNEEEAQKAIAALLVERGKGERLEVHPPPAAPATNRSELEYVQWLNRNVAAVIGPHGGGLCNIKWMASETLVLEIQPRNWPNVHFYEESVGHGLNYWVDIRDALDEDKNMAANIANILAVLRAELGQPPRRGPLLRHRYDWPSVLDDVLGKDPREQPYFVSLKMRCCNKGEGLPGFEGVHVLEGPHGAADRGAANKTADREDLESSRREDLERESVAREEEWGRELRARGLGAREL